VAAPATADQGPMLAVSSPEPDATGRGEGAAAEAGTDATSYVAGLVLGSAAATAGLGARFGSRDATAWALLAWALLIWALLTLPGDDALSLSLSSSSSFS